MTDFQIDAYVLLKNYLIENGYSLRPKKSVYEKPTFVKDENIVVVCVGCGWLKINTKIIRVFYTPARMKEFISKNLIPLS